jgi:kynurenine formamidase
VADGQPTASAGPRGNWGRWGPQDERGAANLLTEEVVLAAVATPRRGTVISLALPIDGSTSGPQGGRVPHLSGRPLPQHFMSIDGGDYAAGARRIKDEMSVADDAIIVSPHGTTTHIDALAHMWRGSSLYNGHPAERVRSYGATRCGIDKLGPILTRGILLDVASFLGVDCLPADTLIDADLLEAVARDRKVELRVGDVVLVRTGWVGSWDGDATRFSRQQPGLSYSGARWLLERDVVAVGADNVAVGALDEQGAFTGSVDEDVHMAALWSHGVPLIEMLVLDELAEADQADFLFVAAPLPITGGTASPLAPVAVL